MHLLLIGATGLVGGEVLKQALADTRVTKITALTRRPLQATHPKLENPVVDFDDLPPEACWWQTDAVICTLGTTIKKAGSQDAFRKVDFAYPLKVAELARAHGAKAYALNSSAGADSTSNMFYLRTKGEIETAMTACNYPSLTIVRPSLIGGKRPEFRLGEKLGMQLLTWFSPLISKRYRIVPAENIAVCLIRATLTAEPGVHIIESENIQLTAE